MEVKVEIKGIENLKTSTEMKEEKEKGEVVGRRLVTKIQFEAELEPGALANIHRFLAAGVRVSAILGSPQSVLELMDKEAALATK